MKPPYLHLNSEYKNFRADEVIRMRKYEHCTLKEIGKRFDISPSLIYQIYYRELDKRRLR